MVRSAECTALRRRCRRKNRNLSFCRTYTKAKKHVSEYPRRKRSDGYRYHDGDGNVLRRSSIEPGLYAPCYPYLAASVFAVSVAVQVQVPCEGRAPLEVVSAQMIVFVCALASREPRELIYYRPRAIVYGCERADGWRSHPRAVASTQEWVLPFATWTFVPFPFAPFRAPYESMPFRKRCPCQRTQIRPSSSLPFARDRQRRSQSLHHWQSECGSPLQQTCSLLHLRRRQICDDLQTWWLMAP